MDETLAILYQALSSQLGLVIRTDDYEKARQRFYVARKQDPALACLQIRRSPINPDGELWIVKSTTKED